MHCDNADNKCSFFPPKQTSEEKLNVQPLNMHILEKVSHQKISEYQPLEQDVWMMKYPLFTAHHSHTLLSCDVE